MEIIKDLPEVFEEFAEQRQKVKGQRNPCDWILLYLFSKGDRHGNGRSNSQPLLYI